MLLAAGSGYVCIHHSLHVCLQEVGSGRFAMYDYGSDEANERQYGVVGCSGSIVVE